jgi:hypothetical protein
VISSASAPGHSLELFSFDFYHEWFKLVTQRGDSGAAVVAIVVAVLGVVTVATKDPLGEAFYWAQCCNLGKHKKLS